MATTSAVKESQTGIRAGKQCIQPTINRTGGEMDARSMQVPSQVNMAKGNKSRKLRGMANPHRTQRQQVLSRYGLNTKRAYESDAKECPIYKTGPLESFVSVEMKGKKV